MNTSEKSLKYSFDLSDSAIQTFFCIQYSYNSSKRERVMALLQQMKVV